MPEFDIAFLGHYTKDTIVLPHETRTVHGGAFSYGSRVAVKMGLRVAVITRLAQEDFEVVHDLTRMGVEVFATLTPQSTNLKLVYPTQTSISARSTTSVPLAHSPQPRSPLSRRALFT